MNFNEKDILEHEQNNGPWGGTTYIKWKTAGIDRARFLAYAKANSWILVDSFSVDNGVIEHHNSVENDYTAKIIERDILPSFENGIYTGYIFQTEWLSVRPGNDTETFNNGFLMLNKNGLEQMVYHRWGE